MPAQLQKKGLLTKNIELQCGQFDEAFVEALKGNIAPVPAYVSVPSRDRENLNLHSLAIHALIICYAHIAAAKVISVSLKHFSP